MFKWLKNKKKSILVEYVEALIIIVPIALLLRTFGYGLYQVPSSSMEPTMLVGERFFADKFTVLYKPLKRGDIITFNDPNFEYSDARFHYMVQKYLWGPRNLTKRIIGAPGDTVESTIVDGKAVIYLNGKKLSEPYVNTYPLVPIDSSKDVWRVYDPDFTFAEQPFYRLDEQTVTEAQKWYKRRGQDIQRMPDAPDYSVASFDIFKVTLGKDQYWTMGDNRIGSSDSRDWGPLDERFIHGKILYRLWSIDSNDAWWVLDFINHPLTFFDSIRWRRSFKHL